jgi:hypothetical protein
MCCSRSIVGVLLRFVSSAAGHTLNGQFISLLAANSNAANPIITTLLNIGYFQLLRKAASRLRLFMML